MERSTILQHLAQVERHVAKGELTLLKQRALVARLENGGFDTAKALELLQQFEEVQALHVADRDRLRNELKSTRDADR